MEFRMLGPFEAWHDGQQVDLGDLQQRYVLVVLLLHLNRPVSTQRLIEIIWGTGRPRSNLIPGYVAKLRKAFATVGAVDSIIEKTTTGYVLRADEDQLDTARFAALCERAREAGDRQRATDLLRAAVDLWRGEYLEDLDVDRVGGSDVISPDDALIDALGDLAELELAAGNHRWVRDQLRPVVHDDPGRRPWHTLLLMRALLANGDQVEAMKVYHRTRDALNEAGLPTPVELRREAWAVQHGPPSSTLPARPGRFTGRDEELAAIETAAAVVAEQDEPGVLWVSGMPGVGKTALAVEAAHRLGRLFPDARLFVALDGFTPNLDPIAPTEALVKLLGDLGVPAERIPPTLTGRSALYQATLAGTKTVVVLDNAAAEDQVRALLPQAPGCLAIVTSRKIGDLDTGDNVHVAPFPATDAAQLFHSLVGPDRLRGRSAEVAEVVGRCGRLPLQIKVVASQFRRHRQWPLDHLVRLLDEAGPWNSAGGFDKQGVVACTVSYQQLDEPQRNMFRLFGANPGHDLSVPAAAAFAGDDVPRARQLLDDLHEVSLLEEAVPERYHILDPLKQFAESVPAGERDDALDRLLDFYLVNTASAIETAFPFDRAQPAVDRHCPVMAAFGDQKAALEWLTAERPNLVAAIRYAATHGRPVHTWQLAVLLWRYFNATNHIDEWIDALELAKQTVMADEDNQVGQAHVLLRLAAAHRRSGRLVHALELAAQALPRWVRLGDLRGEADTLCAIAKPTIELGDHGQAIAHLEAALTKYEQVGELRGQGNALSMLGLLNEQRGNLELAERQHVAAVRMLRLIDDRQGLAHGLDNLGSVRQRLGAFDEALANHQEAHGLALETGDRSVAAYALNNIGNVHRLRNNLDEALRYQEEARIAANGLDDAYLRTELYLDRGATLHVRGDQSDALRSYRAALDLATGTGDRAHQAQANHGIAQALHTTGDHDRAADHWRAAETTFVQLRQPEAGEIRRERQLLRCACTP